jgi:hypothetical protein
MNRTEKTLLVTVAALAFSATLRCGPPGATAQSMGGATLPAESNVNQWRSGEFVDTSNTFNPNGKAVVAGPLVLTHLNYGGMSSSATVSIASDADCKTIVRVVTYYGGDRMFVADGEHLCGNSGLDYSGFVPYKP